MMLFQRTAALAARSGLVATSRPASTFAKATVVGYAGGEPTDLTAKDGSIYAKALSVVISNPIRRGAGEPVDYESKWMQVLYRPTINLPSPIKGSQIYAEGALKVRSNENKDPFVTVDCRVRGQIDVIRLKRDGIAESAAVEQGSGTAMDELELGEDCADQICGVNSYAAH